MAGPQGRAGSPWCIEPAARPGLAKVSPQPRGWPASLNDGTTSKPQSQSGSHRRPGRRLLARCAAPGSLYLDKPTSSAERTQRQPGSKPSEDRTLSPAGLCAHTAPPPARPKASGKCSPSRPLRRALLASGAHSGQRGPQCPACTARAGAERGLRGRRSSLAASAQPCSGGTPREAV